MSDHLNFMMLGLGNGAVYAALAIALVMFYRSSGVVNFATGALSLHAAYTYAFLRKGQLLIILPFLPSTVDVGEPWSFWPAFAAAVGIEMIVGVVVYVAIFRPLRNRTPLAKAVASLGLMVMLTALVSQRAGSEQVLVEPIFPTKRFEWGEYFVIGDRLWFAVTIIALAGLLTLLYRLTRFGLNTRAASETELGVLVSGLSPDRIALANWALGAGVAAIAGVLIAPLTPLRPGTYTLLIVPALAAAVIGRFTVLVPAALAGLAIGMLQSESVFLQTEYSWFPSSGVPELIPLVIVLFVLLLRGQPLPTRGALIRPNLGSAATPRSLVLPLVVFVPLAVVAIYGLDGSYRSALFTSLIVAVFALSLVVVTGYLGQISLAQLSIGGVAGFLLSSLTSDWGVPFPLAPLIAAVGATVVGVLVGMPALRIRGMLVAVTTLLLAVALEAVWFRNPDLTGGLKGRPVEAPSLFGIDLGIGSGRDFPRPAFGLLCLVVLTAVAVGVARLRTSRLGFAMLAVRANERSAASAGISVVRTKIVGFAIASFIAGIAGALLAYKNTIVTFESYSALGGLALFTTAYLAGIASISGGIAAGIIALGGIVFIAVDRSIELGQWYNILSGMGLIFAVIAHPEGIMGTLNESLARLRERLRPAATPPEDGANAVAALPPMPREDGVAEDGVEEANVDEVEAGSARIEPGPTLLAITDLSVHYEGVVALSEVDITVPAGLIVGLIGPNGAGKTTLMDALGGFIAYTGSVNFAGEALDGLAPHQRARRGIARTFQGLDLYEELTVRENVSVGENLRAGSGVGDAGPGPDDLFARLGLDALANTRVSELSQGQRQLVSIARALAGRPRLLLLDEPAAGLDSTESAWLADQLRAVRADGVTILLVDHDMSLVLNLCDLVYVLDFGELIAAGPPAEVRLDREVARAYLGSSHLDDAPAP